jgi:hypothetical protein
MNELITVYTLGMFGVTAERGKLLEHGRKQYAQYPDAPYVHFVPKGKRKPRGRVETFQPYLVIIAGHDAPDPASNMQQVSENVTGTRYSSCDPRWRQEADALIDGYLAQHPEQLIADYRSKVQETK